MAITKQEALEYHRHGRPGKIQVTPTKSCRTQRDLSLAYTPGVADPCLEIALNPHDAFKYTARGNLVAVVTNGTAVLGLGNIGPLAGKPVMEGKGVLFKRFADIDVFDLELATLDPEEIIRVCQLLEPTFGGINLEDIKAPECFHIEETLRKTMKIPVFHDDQHGTAIISGAALLNALEVAGKDISQVRVVFNGAGASGLACAEHYLRLGVRPESLLLCDTKGVLYKGRSDGMNRYKDRFIRDTDARTLADAMRDADVFVGCSVKGAVNKDMVCSMAPNPIVFAMANPDPEISFEDAKQARPDVILATGRSDYPNQVNNVLGFPFIFRGALDVRATTINHEMELAATRALADLAKEDVPDKVCRAYGVERLRFGADYLIPKPFDPRVLVCEARAVAKAAMDSGVAQEPINLDEYREQLERLLGKAHEVTRWFIHRAKAAPKRVVFPEGEHEKIIRASQAIVEEAIACPILLGSAETINKTAEGLGISLDGVQIISPADSLRREFYIEELFRLRQRHGVTVSEAKDLIKNHNYFASMMVHVGDADALVSGINQHFPDTIRPALQVIRVREGLHRVSGLYTLITTQNEMYFLADTSVNIEPTAEELCEIALCAAAEARRFDVEPRVAMLSFSSFGSTKHPLCEKVRQAVRLIRRADPTLIVDGEIMADTAVMPDLITKEYPFSSLRGGANVLIFPDLTSANIAYKLLIRLGEAQTIGPILMGMSKPVQLLTRGCEVEEVVQAAALAVVDAQELEWPSAATPKRIGVSAD
jgi:malate dehydrogenase (oxaloacetate-decarboxylating)(NADP+)